MRANHCRLVGVAVALFVVSAVPSTGQSTSFGDYEILGASYHKFALPGEATITVQVLGSSGSGGIYEVGRGTDLGALWALTGASVPQVGTDQKRITKLQLYRARSTGKRDIIYDASMEEFLSDPGSYPILADGDVFVVESRVKTRFGWRDGLTIVTSAAALTLAIERLTRVVN